MRLAGKVSTSNACGIAVIASAGLATLMLTFAPWYEGYGGTGNSFAWGRRTGWRLFTQYGLVFSAYHGPRGGDVFEIHFAVTGWVTLLAGATLIVLAFVLARAVGRASSRASLVDSCSRRTRRAVRTVGAITLLFMGLSSVLFMDGFGGAIGGALLLVTVVAGVGLFALAMPFRTWLAVRPMSSLS